MSPKPKIVTLLSGGVDSATLLYDLRRVYEVYALSINYGQRHILELVAAKNIAEKAGVSHTLLSLPTFEILGGSSLTDPGVRVPHGHYSHESMKATVVPNRNMIMISLASAYSINLGAYRVAYAAHAGDHVIYPDCRPEFISALSKVLALCHFEPITLLAPFNDMSKAEIINLGVKLGVPYELTYSCYEGQVSPCGRCGTCVERLEAFDFAGVEDPLIRLYQDREFWRTSRVTSW